MNPNCKYEVQTHWGWFRLDEGAYQDYLAGTLWICWGAGKPQQNAVSIPARPSHVSDAAIRLREKATRQDAYTLCREQFPKATVEVPYREYMKDLPISEMLLSARASNGLLRSGLQTFGRVINILDREGSLCSIRNLGVKSEKEIKVSFFNACYSHMTENEKAIWWQSVIEKNDGCSSGEQVRT